MIISSITKSKTTLLKPIMASLFIVFMVLSVVLQNIIQIAIRLFLTNIRRITSVVNSKYLLYEFLSKGFRNGFLRGIYMEFIVDFADVCIYSMITNFERIGYHFIALPINQTAKNIFFTVG